MRITASHIKRSNWPKETIDEAIKLRHEGLSYGDISKKMGGIAKSTLCEWIGEIKRPGYITKEDMLNHLKSIQPLAVAVLKKQRERRLEIISKRVKNEVDAYKLSENKEYLQSVLSMLYWAEGSKGRGHLTFANTDPKLSLLFLTLLRKSYSIDESKLRVRLHLHYYHPIKKIKLFWSSLLGIPLTKFGKIYHKPRSKTRKFRQNFAGICFITYYSEDLRFEILDKAYKIADKLVPVA